MRLSSLYLTARAQIQLSADGVSINLGINISQVQRVQPLDCLLIFSRVNNPNFFAVTFTKIEADVGPTMSCFPALMIM